jgi:hypothetical protein
VRISRGTLGVLVVAAALCFAAPAGAATVSLGRIAPMGVPGGCSGCTFFQAQSDPASASYVVPAGGPWTVTSWSARGGPTTPDSARLRILRPTGIGNQYMLVAESDVTPIAVVAAPVTPVSIPVQPGDRLGMRTSGGAGDMPAIHPSAFVGDGVAGVMGNMMLGETTGQGGDYAYGVNPSSFLNLSATLTSPDPVAPQKKCKKKKRKKKKGKAAPTSKKKKKKCKRKKRKKKP